MNSFQDYVTLKQVRCLVVNYYNLYTVYDILYKYILQQILYFFTLSLCYVISGIGNAAMSSFDFSCRLYTIYWQGLHYGTVSYQDDIRLPIVHVSNHSRTNTNDSRVTQRKLTFQKTYDPTDSALLVNQVWNYRTVCSIDRIVNSVIEQLL